MLALALSTALPQSSAAAALRVIPKIKAPISALRVHAAAASSLQSALFPSLNTSLMSPIRSLETLRLQPELSPRFAPQRLEAKGSSPAAETGSARLIMGSTARGR